MLHFFKKIKKNTWRYYFTLAYQKSWWYDLQFLRHRVIPPPKNPKNQNFEKMKQVTVDIIILHMCTKNHNHMRHGLWDNEIRSETGRIFCPFGPVFAVLLPPMNNASGDVIILHVYQKSRSHDACFLRYGVRQTLFFVILGHFLPFYSTTDPEN